MAKMAAQGDDNVSAQDMVICLGRYGDRVEARLESWRRNSFARRLWARDHTLWARNPREVSDRLGWLALPDEMASRIGELQEFARAVWSDGIRHVVLLGMGGSSLAPEVYQRSFGNAADRPVLRVLDSTHPQAVRDLEAAIDVSQTLFVASSKSGTTTETLSFLYYFWERLGEAGVSPGEHFVAITDPGTPLATLAGERGFRQAFSGPPDVGGRFSALSVFGLVPAALVGVDLGRLLESASRFVATCGPSKGEGENSALRLGAALGELALEGRDKVTFFTSPALSSFPDWLEQLIAESTGKDDSQNNPQGIVPVVGEPIAAEQDYGRDRVFVEISLDGDPAPGLDEFLAAAERRGDPLIRIRLRELTDIGRELFRWEMATAAAGAVLRINPFNQPDVQLAKTLAQEAMKRRGEDPAGEAADESGGQDDVSVSQKEELETRLRNLLGKAREGYYVGLQAYLPQACEVLGRIRRLLGRPPGRDVPLATTLGLGPRFLHSTGQLHKGGRQNGLFVQLVDRPAADVSVPETDYTFGQLIHAQGVGDCRALRERGRRVLRIDLGSDAEAGLRIVEELLSSLD